MLLCHESLETYYQVAFEGVKLHIWPNSSPQHAWPTSGGFLVASLFRCLRSIRYSKSRKSRCTIHITKMSRNILQAFTTLWHWLIDLISSWKKKILWLIWYIDGALKKWSEIIWWSYYTIMKQNNYLKKANNKIFCLIIEKNNVVKIDIRDWK